MSLKKVAGKCRSILGERAKLLAINTAGMHRYMSVDIWKFYVSDKSLRYLLEIRIFFF